MGRRLKPKPLSKVLVANRGEIAVRVIRACREMDILTVAVFSEADRHSLHVQLADEAVCIGPPAPTESYLNIDAIVAAARETDADAVHPGYGFLAESAAFAARIEKEKLTFIGPPPGVIATMGSKIESRATVVAANVPVVPGTEKGSNDPAAVAAAARDIEMPVFVKASAGGGGKGMRRVDDRDKLEPAVREAVAEARAAFGDGTVYVEKLIEDPRHIEFQILADAHGNVVHLFERECSIQRRHQKLVEETPALGLTAELRTAMGKAAVAAARATGYVNAGTVEFILDRAGNFYFLEMNTRIQVEHPITELVVGIDLVQWQLRIAAGEKLAFTQDDLIQRGHAIECRVYAEDEVHNFMPSCGHVIYLRVPSGPGVRNDTGIYEGWEVSAYYDPILSKLVTWGTDRETARLRMLRALDEYVVHGVKTSVDLHKRIVGHSDFAKGAVDTGFIARHAKDLLDAGEDGVPDEAFIVAALLRQVGGAGHARATGDSQNEGAVPVWGRMGSWRIGDGGGRG